MSSNVAVIAKLSKTADLQLKAHETHVKELLSKGNDAVRKHYEDVKKAESNLELDTLERVYDFGEMIAEVTKTPDKYDGFKVEDFCSLFQHKRSWCFSVYSLACSYDRPALTDLISRAKAGDYNLGISAAFQLARIVDAAERRKVEDLAIAKKWTVNVLEEYVSETGKTKLGKSAGPRKPESVDGIAEQFLRSSTDFLHRFNEVWNHDEVLVKRIKAMPTLGKTTYTRLNELKETIGNLLVGLQTFDHDLDTALKSHETSADSKSDDEESDDEE
jgi:hypothetical protein